ncbi:hypothetical protein E3T26_03780 [Cryobacterium sp. TMT1-21]|uniref:hypothetical protein n=1 Tax=Cryobacterium sp. TMT1-21 TaxID=1259234 RepID=UPI001069CC51|nr:hypothetical protein [Cryobacterium sp. TMT1-21]TFD16576.1 hypothetical protein E3T26_03780 [Cryobacterium sp. TMT1-21]
MKGDLEIDILVPSYGARFETATVGGRGFDAVPGLRLAFSVDPIVLHVGVILTDGTPLGFVVRVPPVELGGWKIGTAPVSGTRLDAARILHTLADSARQGLVVANAGVPADRLAALIRALVSFIPNSG